MPVRLVIAATVFLASAGPSLACTPAGPPKLSRAQELELARSAADASASPRLAAAVRDAADISVAEVQGYDPAPDTDVPEAYRDSLGWYRESSFGLEPVRYRLKVQRPLKGAPPAEFVFRFRQAWFPGDGDRIWTVAPNDDFEDFAQPRNEQAFWHEARLTYGRISGGPGDCSNQIALDPAATYIVFRDKAGLVTAADPLSVDDPLPGLIATLVADPALSYPWRPTVTEYLRLAGVVVRVQMSDCRKERAKVLETLRERSTDDAATDPAPGEDLGLYDLQPQLLIAGCRRGDEYLATGWPWQTRLHPIIDGVVHFEDRWTQLRFSGEKAMPLAKVRETLSATR